MTLSVEALRDGSAPPGCGCRETPWGATMNAALPIDFDFELDDPLNVVESVLLECCDPVALDPATSTKLAKLGVEGEALADLHVAPVRLDGDRFEFARNLDCDIATWGRVVVGVVVPVRDELNTAFDLIAWNLTTGAIATWRGEASILGEFNLLWRLGEEALRVFPTVLAWLIAGRDGLVIIDSSEARWRLIGEELVVDDAEFGASLEAALRLPEPKVFVRAA